MGKRFTKLFRTVSGRPRGGTSEAPGEPWLGRLFQGANRIPSTGPTGRPRRRMSRSLPRTPVQTMPGNVGVAFHYT